MKSLLFLTVTLTFVSLQACSEVSSSPRSSEQDAVLDRSPLETVNQRMSAYNRHDLTAFLETYSNEVEVFTYPDKSLGKGKQHLQSIFESMFEAGDVQVTIHHQIAKDSYVVNQETVSDGDRSTEYVSIYEVRDELIRSVRFVRD